MSASVARRGWTTKPPTRRWKSARKTGISRTWLAPKRRALRVAPPTPYRGRHWQPGKDGSAVPWHLFRFGVLDMDQTVLSTRSDTAANEAHASGALRFITCGS